MDFTSADDSCPRCGNALYLNPSMRLLAGPCGHKLCDSCLDQIFASDSTVACPQCRTQVRRKDYIIQTFDDVGVEREITVRRKMMKVFNKQQSDFPSLREYNDYLEWVEELIWNLVNGENVEETQASIAEYKEVNRDVTTRNIALAAAREKKLQDSLRFEKEMAERIREEDARVAEQERKSRYDDSVRVLDGLQSGKLTEQDVSRIAESRRLALARKAKREAEQAAAAAAAAADTGVTPAEPMYAPIRRQLEFVLPQPLSQQDKPGDANGDGDAMDVDAGVDADALKAQRRRAAGFDTTLVLSRALQEALNGLFVFAGPTSM